MKSKRKILSLAISALLVVGVTSYPMPSYADQDNNQKEDDPKNQKVDVKKADVKQAAAQSNSDSDKRSSSGDTSTPKITICHVPPGNPANKHTIHIAFSAWLAHKAHTNNIGPDYADYLGSCNSKATTTTKETLHVISGCTGTTRETLETKVQSYFEPITVADTALDDESINTAMSQCLDKGDSSDSSKSNADSSKSTSGGKGRGHDSVSDSGNHHRIRGCQNKDTTTTADSSKNNGLSDSDKDVNNLNYHQKLKDADTGYDTANSIKDPIVVSDSSLDDNGVWTEYKKCAQDASNANKLDPNKTGQKKGDSGHRQHVLKSCVDASGDALRNAIVAYKAKASTKDIILTETSYNDVSIKKAVDACVSSGAKDTVTTSFSPNVAISGVTITGATITNAVITNGVITGGTVTAGTGTTATGDIANVIGGAISSGTSSGGSTTGGTTTGGTTTGATITGSTVTGATVSTGVSGRLNFREIFTPQ